MYVHLCHALGVIHVVLLRLCATMQTLILYLRKTLILYLRTTLTLYLRKTTHLCHALGVIHVVLLRREIEIDPREDLVTQLSVHSLTPQVLLYLKKSGKKKWGKKKVEKRIL